MKIRIVGLVASLFMCASQGVLASSPAANDVASTKGAAAKTADAKATSAVGKAPAAPASAQEKSCQQFVQNFYDWYLKISKDDNKKEGPSELALKTKADSFDAVLAAKLKEDSDVAAKFPGEIVGLDFDPFLNAQDMAEKYAAGKVTAKGASYVVEVFGTWNGKKNVKPDVCPELAFKNNHWVFVNFRYPSSDQPSNSDLISVLNQLKKDRPPLPGAKKPASAVKKSK